MPNVPILSLWYSECICLYTDATSRLFYIYILYCTEEMFSIIYLITLIKGFPGGGSGKEPACQWGDITDAGWIPGSGKSPGGGRGKPLQPSFLENPMNRETWWATVHRVAKSQALLKWLSRHAQWHVICRNHSGLRCLLFFHWYPHNSSEPFQCTSAYVTGYFL